MANSDEQEQRIIERTIRELMKLGFEEPKARKAVTSIGDPSDANLAMNWLFDHGEDDKGGAVKFQHCPHVDELGLGSLLPCSKLEFGKPCLEGCKGDENWICLMCGDSRCGRYGKRHAMQHWQTTKKDEEMRITVADAAAGKTARGHCLVLSQADLSLWCYECDCYVQHRSLHLLVKTMESLKFGGAAADDASAEGSLSTAAPREPNTEVGSSIGVEPCMAHGALGDASWPLPKLVRACREDARPGYKTMKAHEYLDEDDVLRAKINLLADLVRRSQNCVAYTGAGISTASGINDYATKADGSVAAAKRKVSPWEAQPTLAHRALVAMYKNGHLKHWVQQNHDGLPQKAGFPQNDINEIHGAWYDPSNPVVPMSGSLREDLIKTMLDWEEKVDLCLAMGTSMVGMNADRMAVAPAQRAKRGQARALGTVIVSLQQTQYDSIAALRIFATIDRVMEMLATELGLTVPPAPAQRPWAQAPILKDLPYQVDGQRNESSRLTLDLRPGSKLRIVNQPLWDQEVYGNVCEVIESPESRASEGHISLLFGKAGSKGSIVRVLGRWWLDAAIEGAVQCLPVVPYTRV
jgi:NAD-dependent SIR2 family protein deacetylase